MNARTSIKLVGVAGLGLATFLATTLWVRGSSARTREEPASSAQAPETATLRMFPVGTVELPTPSDEYVASFVMQSFQLNTSANVIQVAAQASLEDRRPNPQYIWALKILAKSSDEVLFEKWYDDQIFSVPSGVVTEPMFADEIKLPLPEGDYRAALVIYSVPQDTGVIGLSDPVVAQQFECTRGLSAFRLTKFIP